MYNVQYHKTYIFDIQIGEELKVIFIILMFITTLFSSENLEKISLQLKEKEQFQSAGFHVSLTQEEKQYIKDKRAINVCIKSDQEPLVIKDKEGYLYRLFGAGIQEYKYEI